MFWLVKTKAKVLSWTGHWRDLCVFWGYFWSAKWPINTYYNIGSMSFLSLNKPRLSISFELKNIQVIYMTFFSFKCPTRITRSYITVLNVLPVSRYFCVYVLPAYRREKWILLKCRYYKIFSACPSIIKNVGIRKKKKRSALYSHSKGVIFRDNVKNVEIAFSIFLFAFFLSFLCVCVWKCPYVNACQQ